MIDNLIQFSRLLYCSDARLQIIKEAQIAEGQKILYPIFVFVLGSNYFSDILDNTE